MEIKESFIKKILECEWLRNCGSEFDLGFEVEYIKSRSKAEKLIKSMKWENVCLETGGDFTVFLHKNHKEDYNKYWNEVVIRIKNEYISIISEKIEIAVAEFNDKEAILNDMKFNLITLFMLNFYSEYYSSDFYNKMLKIYLSGHLPCGWSGNYAEGKFIVY